MTPRAPRVPAGVASVVATLVVLLSACASAGSAAGASGKFSYGYMIPGPQVANALGTGATDTLPELTSGATVPTLVTNAITLEVAQGGWNNGCTRRFGGPAVYAVIFHRACDSALGPDADPMVVMGFGADGRARGRLRWTGPSTVTLLFPARRF